MIRDLDPISLTFSLWEQAREDLHQVEEQLLRARREQPPLNPQQIDEIAGRLTVLKGQTDRLREQAIAALLERTRAGYKGT